MRNPLRWLFTPADPIAPDPLFGPGQTPFHQYWVRGQLPDPGGAIYAYATTQLLPFYPIDRFGEVQRPMRAEAPNLYIAPAALPTSLYEPIGQIYGQPLYDPNAIPGEGVNA